MSRLPHEGFKHCAFIGFDIWKSIHKMFADDVGRIDRDGSFVKYPYIPDYSLVIDDGNAICQYVHGNNAVDILFNHFSAPSIAQKGYSNIKYTIIV